MPHCLALSIRKEKELRPPLHLGVVAIKKGAFRVTLD